MSEPATTVLSFAEYLAWEERQAERYELVGSRAFLMAGGTERHDLMALRLWALLDAGAATKGCRAFQGNRKLKVPSGDTYYPDVMVVCGPAANVHYETDATLVVEVLPPKTRNQDRREKARQYATLPSIKAYVVAEADVRRMEVACPDTKGNLSWQVLGAGNQLDTPFGVWDLDDIYDAVDARAST